MPEEVLFETEARWSRADVASYLRRVAEKLDDGESITMTAGEQSVTVDPPARPTFEVKVERETSRGADSGELSIEFELEWDEGAEDAEGAGDASLSIE